MSELRVGFSKYRLILIAYLQLNVSQLIGGVASFIKREVSVQK